MRLSSLLVVAMLAACAPVGPEFVRPDVPANPAWLEAELEQFEASTPELADWWKQLGAPVLDQLIETALQQNNNLRIAIQVKSD